MNRPVSIYLDLLRFSAAMVVFLGHLAGTRFTGGLFWQISPLMDEAVTIFFILSGFVISYVTADRGEQRDAYIVARFVRIASVAVPALAVTAMLDAAGLWLRPELYSATWGFTNENPLLQYLSGLLFLQRIWYSDLRLGSNLPYWSLNYEVWYYLFFGIAWFARGTRRLIWLLAAAVLCGPTVVSMFPIWLLGVLAHRCCAAAGRWGTGPGLAVFLGSGVALAAYLGLSGNLAAAVPMPAWLNQPDLAHHAVVGILFSLHLVGASAAATAIGPVLARFASPIRWLAGATFTLYLFHLPVAQFIITLLPWPPSHPAARLAVLGGTLVVVYAIAAVTERRKELWFPVARSIVAAMSGRPRGQSRLAG